VNKITISFCIIAIFMLMSCSKKEPGSDKNTAAGKKFESADRYIATKGGLRMREKPDASAKQVGLVPEGEKVVFLEETGSDITISGATGKWSRVKWGDKTGWVFGGFLSGEITLNSDKLNEHFISIAISSRPVSGDGITASKKIRGDSIHGDGGNCEEQSEVEKDSTVVKNNRILFKRINYRGADCAGQCPEPDCKSTIIETFECSIDGNEIMKVKEGDTFKGEYKCSSISTKKNKSSGIE
jgi:hypothetical protein